MYDLPSTDNWKFVFNKPAKFQQYSVIIAKSLTNAKICLFFPLPLAFFADTVELQK
jgi:hypothetical protein